MSNDKTPPGVTESGSVELTESDLDHVAGGHAQYNPKELQITQKVPFQRGGTSAAATITQKVVPDGN